MRQDSEGEREYDDLELLGVLALLGEAVGVFFGDATTGFAGDEASVGSAASTSCLAAWRGERRGICRMDGLRSA